MCTAIDNKLINEKFVIWGIGLRGKLITEIIEERNVVAYIESDNGKIGRQFHGIPIISFEEYKNFYSNYFIIVSPYDEDDILKILLKNGIYCFFRMSQVPSEMRGYGESNFWKYPISCLMKNKVNVLFGINLYSYLIYKMAIKLGYEDTYLYLSSQQTEIVEEMKMKLDCKFLTKTEEMNTANILLCSREDELERLRGKYNTANVVDIYDLSDKIVNYFNKDVCRFKNMHLGERCFIVATGPSLRENDLKQLNEYGEICFGLNRIYNIDENIWKPDYYVFADRNGLKKYWKQIAEYNVDEKFLGDSYVGSEKVIGTVSKLHILTDDSYDLKPRFSERVEQKVYGYGTVTYVAIQLAVYMGFKKIYLLGVDCNYKHNGENNYFFNETQKDSVTHNEYFMIKAYKSAKKYADEHGIKIFNATRGGKLEVFERVDFDSLF